MADNMSCVIANLCDGDLRLRFSVAECGDLRKVLTPRDLLGWYAGDMEAARREASGELYRIAALESAISHQEATA